MAEIDVMKAQMVRRDVNDSWGLRLQGGADQHQPITIARVVPGSPAARIGLQPGDEVTEIGDSNTHSMTLRQAHEAMKLYGLSLILTIERRTAAAAPPAAPPAPSAATSYPSYQPYDLNRGVPHQATRPAPQNYNIQTAHSKPYQEPPGRTPRSQPVHPVHKPQEMPDYYKEGPPPKYTPVYREPYASDNPADYEGPVQSRTFKLLQSMMENEGPGAGPPADPRRAGKSYDYQEELLMGERGLGPYVPHQSRTFKLLQDFCEYQEPAAGSFGLPPPRSKSMEEWKQKEAEKRAQEAAYAERQKGDRGDRVKVFMPQQHNTPIGLYSTVNVMDTFSSQADIQLAQQEARAVAEPPFMSPAQQAVLAQDYVAGSSDM